MTCEIQNISRRLVSVHCNSGMTCHLPPGYTHELPEQEITGNAFVKKLQDRKLIVVRTASKTGSEAKPKKVKEGVIETEEEKPKSSKKKS